MDERNGPGTVSPRALLEREPYDLALRNIWPTLCLEGRINILKGGERLGITCLRTHLLEGQSVNTICHGQLNHLGQVEGAHFADEGRLAGHAGTNAAQVGAIARVLQGDAAGGVAGQKTLYDDAVIEPLWLAQARALKVDGLEQEVLLELVVVQYGQGGAGCCACRSGCRAANSPARPLHPCPGRRDHLGRWCVRCGRIRSGHRTTPDSNRTPESLRTGI